MLLAIKHPYIFHLLPPYIHPQHPKHTTNSEYPLTLPPLGLEQEGGSGARVQTGVDRKWLFSLAPRSWPQHPSTFHFSHLSLSGHVAQDGSLTFTLRLALFFTTCNMPVNQCNNSCFNLNYIRMTCEGWRVNSGLPQSFLGWHGYILNVKFTT